MNQTLVLALSSDNNNNIYFVTGDTADIYKIGGNDGLLSYIGGLKNKILSTFAVSDDGLYFAISKTSGLVRGSPPEITTTGEANEAISSIKFFAFSKVNLPTGENSSDEERQ